MDNNDIKNNIIKFINPKSPEEKEQLQKDNIK